MQSEPLSTGIKELDNLTAGLRSGELVVIAALPGAGKSALALTIARYVGIDAGKTVAFFPLDSDKDNILIRILCSQARINITSLRSDNITEHEQARLKQALNKLKQSNLHIFPKVFSLSDIKLKIQNKQDDQKIDLAIIDYIQLIKSDSPRWSYGAQEADTSAQLKRLALELDIPVIAVCRLLSNKSFDHKPQLSDLKEWNNLHADADIILLMDTQLSSEYDDSYEGMAEISIAKNRNGMQAKFRLAWSKQCSRFDNLWREDDRSKDQHDQDHQPVPVLAALLQEWNDHTSTRACSEL